MSDIQRPPEDKRPKHRLELHLNPAEVEMLRIIQSETREVSQADVVRTAIRHRFERVQRYKDGYDLFEAHVDKPKNKVRLGNVSLIANVKREVKKSDLL